MNEQALYQRLVGAVDGSVIEADIRTKGILLTERGVEPKIYIRKNLTPQEKLKVLLHEYSHYIHLKKFYEQESRAECELIAESSVFYILRELGIEVSDEPKLTQFTKDPSRIKQLSVKIQQISDEIIAALK